MKVAIRPRSRPFVIEARGPFALFTRADAKVERASWDVIPPSCVQGLCESILDKRGVLYVTERIEVLNPIQFIMLQRNEVTKSPVLTARHGFSTNAVRAQRGSLVLRDVHYRITLHIELGLNANPDKDNIHKFERMFEDRLDRGQCLWPSAFGCREMFADVRPAQPNGKPPIPVSRPLGCMPRGWRYTPRREPVLFEATLREGVVLVPPRDWE